MAEASLSFDSTSFELLQERVRSFPGNAEQAINDYLHTQGGEILRNNIQNLLPASGRTWKKKAPPASAGDPFGQKNENLAVTIGTSQKFGAKGKYNYLYFPDDGTNTRRHAGEQHFMQRGVEQALPRVREDMLSALTEKFNEE